ncbi:MAG TPA: lytic transglycosylase domain-containing protein [Terriglobia bacterium]|nr:lytic transglycosylase domain-containing protein [Terriglobia bacterium]
MKVLAAALSVLLSVTAQATGGHDQAKPMPVTPDNLKAWKFAISAASRRFGVPETWIRAVILAESGGRIAIDGQPITSSAGAMGLMQVMPETYADMREKYGLGVDPYEVTDNIMAGAAYLAELCRQFGFPGLFAAYNAGPERYLQHLETGVPLPDETIFYMHAITVTLAEDRQMDAALPSKSVPPASSSAAKSPLFFVTNGDKSSDRAASIFVPLGSSDVSHQ